MLTMGNVFRLSNQINIKEELLPLLQSANTSDYQKSNSTTNGTAPFRCQTLVEVGIIVSDDDHNRWIIAAPAVDSVRSSIF